MIAFGKDKFKVIKLSKEEQSVILQYCENLSPALHNKIKHMTDGTIYLLEDETYTLLDAFFHANDVINNNKIAGLFKRLAARVPLTNEIAEQLDRLEGIDYTDTQAAEQVWKELEEEKKTAPDPFRGYLTPQQITRFQEYHWGDAEFPLQFNHNLSLKEANQSIFFRNTVLFLNKLIEFKDKPTSTAKGNLNRKFVKMMFDEMELDGKYRESTIGFNKVLNETDLFPLHIIKIVCKCAGLIENRSKKILLLKKHHHLLSEEKAGELYYLLFEAYFQKFNLAYLDRFPEMDGIQGTFDFSLYRLSVICNDYQSVEDLYYEIFLPAIMENIEDTLPEHRMKERVMTSRIIYPLFRFGLLEGKFKQDKFFNRIDQARKTPLFDKFISLNL